jgi:hypothetical protein
MGILDQELVDILARRIGGIALWNRILPVLLRVYICRGARKQNAVAGVDKVCRLARSSVQRNLHRLATSAANGLCI